MMENPSQTQEPSLQELRVRFPKADVLRTSSGMNYAKFRGAVIAADPSRSELQDQMQEYFDNRVVCAYCDADIKRTGDGRWFLARAADINGYCARSPDDMHHVEGEP
jgi:hypothetical protein